MRPEAHPSALCGAENSKTHRDSVHCENFPAQEQGPALEHRPEIVLPPPGSSMHQAEASRFRESGDRNSMGPNLDGAVRPWENFNFLFKFVSQSCYKKV